MIKGHISAMPKNYPKNRPKKKAPKKAQPKVEPKPVSLMKSKYYWVTMTSIILVFAVIIGYSTGVALANEALIVGTVLSIIGFAFYLGFVPSIKYSKRALFIFVGASVVGFSIWAAMTLSLTATAILPQVTDSIGPLFFASTTLIICLIAGALIGDLIGKNIDRIGMFFNDKFRN